MALLRPERVAPGEGNERGRDLDERQDEVDVVVYDRALRHPRMQRFVGVLRDRDAAPPP